MIFTAKNKGTQIVWDGKKNVMLARFKDGTFTTSDKETIDKLTKLGFTSEEEAKEPDNVFTIPQ